MRYIIKKIITLIITLLLVSFFTFFAFEIIPGDAALSMLGTEANEEALKGLREEMGLNDPFWVRYIRWGKNFLHGDMGVSYSYKISVSQIILDKLPITATLTILAFLFILILSIPLGILSAKWENSWIDKLIMICNQINMAIPAFFMGIILTYLFGLVFHLFTPGGYIPYTENKVGFFSYLILPSIAIALPKSAMTIKLLRSSLIGQLKADYVRTAYSKGNGSNRVLYHHVLKNAFIPVVTFLAIIIADIVANSLIIEQVFSIPGMGRMLITSISNRDYPVVQAIIMIIAFLVIFVNFLVDFIYQWIDPRIELK